MDRYTIIGAILVIIIIVATDSIIQTWTGFSFVKEIMKVLFGG